jgi:hypothetical protein
MKPLTTTLILGIFAMTVHEHYCMTVASAILNPSDELLLSEVVPAAQNAGMNFLIFAAVMTVLTALVLNIREKHFAS